MRTLTFLAVLTLLMPAAGLFAEDEAPAAPPVGPEIQQLIDDLSADDFRIRERASQALAAKGEAARAALEHAAAHSASVEARWRAQQILRRLDGAGAKPLGEPEEATTPKSPEARRADVEELQRRLMEQLRRGRLGPVQPFRSGKVTAPGLELVPEGFGRVRLVVTEEGSSEKPRVYRGRSLETILEEHPELAEHPAMEELKAKRDADPFARARRLLQGGRIQIAPGQGMTSFFSSNGVTVKEDANGVVVKIVETDENGVEVVKEYRGKTREEIKEKHPEIADRIPDMGGFVRIRPPQVFGRRTRPQVTPSVPAPREGLGVMVATPEDALAAHLGLAEGHGALVRSVIPGSQAEELGFERHDVIVRVNETEITSIALLRRLLGKAAVERLPLTVEVIRRGEPVTLTR